MSLNREDLSYLYDIYECITRIKEFTRGMRYHQYIKDKKTISAVERQFEIIGIASNKLSKETRDSLNHIPWGMIIGLRNMIAHEYKDIRADKIWEISKTSLSELQRELKKIKELKPYIKK